MSALRPDLAIIAQTVPPGARVLDVGCGDGALLAYLAREKGCDARGIELSREGVSAAVAKGLSVVQGDADTDLADYPSGTFDVVILSETLQAVRQPQTVLSHLLRIGARAIVSFPNFGYWRARWSVAAKGRMPVTATLPAQWYDTANIHLCTIADFEALCAAQGVRIERAVALQGPKVVTWGANWRADLGLFVLRRG
jgi:methionine biosynthesis protein MetW